MEPNRKLILGVLHSYKYRKTDDRPVDVIDEGDFDDVVDQILYQMWSQSEIAPPLQQAAVMRGGTPEPLPCLHSFGRRLEDGSWVCAHCGGALFGQGNGA